MVLGTRCRHGLASASGSPSQAHTLYNYILGHAHSPQTVALRALATLLNPVRMLIRVLAEDEEEVLFNTDCQIALLLDSIKKSQGIPKTEVIDLCSIEGVVKELYKHKKANAVRFFKLRELCLVVSIQNPFTDPFFIPVLKEYAENKCFEAVLNAKEDRNYAGKSRARPTGISTSLPRSPGGARNFSAKSKTTKRRYTQLP